MPEKSYLLLPLLAAQLYALGAIALKTASLKGVDFVRLTFVTNLAVCSVFLIFPNWTQPDALFPTAWWPAFLLALLFMLGQVFALLSIWRGDVSIATPILSSKVVMVAFAVAVFLDEPVGINVWIAAFVTLIGVCFLQARNSKIEWQKMGETILYSLLSAAAFGLFDAAVQHWSAEMSYERFVPWGMMICAFLSIFLIPLFPPRAHPFPNGSAPFLAMGAALTAVQGLLLISAIGIFEAAAECNVVYGSRGVWSFVFLYLFGAYFANVELKMPAIYVALRLFGSLLIAIAIVMVFW